MTRPANGAVALFLRALREPLVHFMIGGLLLFAYFSGWGAPQDDEIVLTADLEAQLLQGWSETRERMPSEEERERLVESWVRDEVLAREALRLGFDQDDAVIQRRLASKMEFYLGTTIEVAAPKPEVLQAWYAGNADRYERPGQMDFDQLWFADEAQANAALAALRRGSDWRNLGGQISLPGSIKGQEPQQIVSRFGSRFFRELTAVDELDTWAGPIGSSLGFHLVRIHSRTPGQVPPLDTIRADVERDWMMAEKERLLDEAYADYRAQYRVVLPE